MTSPFASFANCTVVYSLPSAEPVIGPTGNLFAATTQLVAVAYITPDPQRRTQSNSVFADGMELNRIAYKGRWIAPSDTPRRLEPEQTGEAIIWRLQPGFRLPAAGFADMATYEAFVAANEGQIAEQGKFVAALAPPGAFGVETVLGDRFEGIFLVKTLWADEV